MGKILWLKMEVINGERGKCHVWIWTGYDGCGAASWTLEDRHGACLKSSATTDIYCLIEVFHPGSLHGNRVERRVETERLNFILHRLAKFECVGRIRSWVCWSPAWAVATSPSHTENHPPARHLEIPRTFDSIVRRIIIFLWISHTQHRVNLPRCKKSYVLAHGPVWERCDKSF